MLNSIVILICFLISGELACESAIENNNKKLDGYDMRDDVLIPHKFLVRPLQLIAEKICKQVNDCITEVESSNCEKFERNKKRFAQFRERGYQMRKVYCDRSRFLRNLHRCSPKIEPILGKMGKEISKYKVSNEYTFKQICW